ncbi:UDP-4-amino-4,6-dideoxy-N-acetyl-beta-L-altrosamine transaminase [Helicobacter anatolicus]|uniref:UDP-4-amino-4, 6-dideoxy-N-acetyl-beta-L-altrosamine transaminase n=1 Tax=Helicobacter anatolicus TaxID=2905874 RepID=UPI001E53F745|nr:UDP-4-amino-4,6-dideoxy-N-acetyl-beta-L-altrosamine transaminase [Helicobacter anatolicus]MCE3039733.1 UDP-4-amino-4,6-dideoxy-N-acetyl-beta-L-altrosamine transaminase [Helicobacter anatolicus]
MQPYSTQFLQEDDFLEVITALKNPLLTQGNITLEFEKALSKFCNAKYALVFNSATSALYAAYNALNLENSEVITTPLSFVATTNMLLQNHATPIFCDIKQDGNINPEKIIPLITKKTKAIVSVDYGGKSVDVDSIKAICKEYNLSFISDSSHAIGSEYKNQKVGGLADATIFSFHPVKPMTTLEGGALLTNSKAIYEKAKLVRSHGVIKKNLWHYDVICNGFNFRMNEVQAALGISQLKKLPHFIQVRENIAKFYDSFFANNPYFTTIHQNNPYISSNHLYTILLNPTLQPKKEKVFQLFQENGLGVQVHYKPIYHFSYYKNLFGNISLPQTEAFYNATLSIPCHHKLELHQAEKIAQKILYLFSKI